MCGSFSPFLRAGPTNEPESSTTGSGRRQAICRAVPAGSSPGQLRPTLSSDATNKRQRAGGLVGAGPTIGRQDLVTGVPEPIIDKGYVTVPEKLGVDPDARGVSRGPACLVGRFESSGPSDSLKKIHYICTTFKKEPFENQPEKYSVFDAPEPNTCVFNWLKAKCRLVSQAGRRGFGPRIPLRQ